MRLLTKEEIQKLAHIIRETQKEAAGPTINIRTDAARASPRATMSLSPSVSNPLGTKGIHESQNALTKADTAKGSKPSGPK